MTIISLPYLLSSSFGSFYALFCSKKPWVSFTLWGVDNVLEVDGVALLLRELPAPDRSLVLLPPQVGEQVHLRLDQHTAHLHGKEPGDSGNKKEN